MDSRWLTADERKLKAAIEELDEDERAHVEGRSWVPAGIAFLFLFAYFGVVWLAFADGIDIAAGRVPPGATAGLIVSMAIFAVLWWATR